MSSHGQTTVISIWYYGINYGRYTAVLWTYIREYYGSITANCGLIIGFGLEEKQFYFLFSDLGAILANVPRISQIFSDFLNIRHYSKGPVLRYFTAFLKLP